MNRFNRCDHNSDGDPDYVWIPIEDEAQVIKLFQEKCQLGLSLNDARVLILAYGRGMDAVTGWLLLGWPE